MSLRSFTNYEVVMRRLEMEKRPPAEKQKDYIKYLQRLYEREEQDVLGELR